MSELQKRSHLYWSQRATEFSGLRMDDYNGPMKSKFLEYLRNILGDGTGRKALDMGCGAGFFSLLLSELGFEVTGVDFSREMLGEAKNNSIEKGFSSVSFQQMDVQNLVFDENVFDVVLSRNVTWILEYPETFYSEMIRVLKPKGIGINMDANYGAVFKASDDKGETPIHPTQSESQLRERNAIATAMAISSVNRPIWDINELLKLGVRKLSVTMDLESDLDILQDNLAYTRASKQTKAELVSIVIIK